MYHVVFTTNINTNYIFFVQFHYFTNKIRNYTYYRNEFISYFENNIKPKHLDILWFYTPRLVFGLENIPSVSVDREYKIMLVSDEISYYELPKSIKVIGDIPEELKEKILSYKKQFITIDYDNRSMLEKYYELRRKYNNNFKVYQTSHGFHIYIYQEWHDFDELLNIRKEEGDDEKRLSLDKLYINNGVPFLANTLFNKRNYDYIHTLNIHNSYEEKEITEKDYIGETKYDTPFHLVPFSVNINGVIIMRHKEWENEIIAKASPAVVKSKEELHEILEKFDYRKYINIDKYMKKKERQLIVKMRWEKKGDNLLIIYVPEKEMGKVIGKEGKNVKVIEKDLGLKVRVLPLEKEARELEEKKYETIERIERILRELGEDEI